MDQLLTLRAPSQPRGPLADVDLVAVANLALADAAPLAAERQAVLELDAPTPCSLRGDSQALRSLVRNLIDNAIVHGGDAPRVNVNVAGTSQSVVLRVDDSGPGIAPADRARVFDRFHRPEGSSSEGSGLGLAIVRAIAAQHGGQVTLADSPLGGLRVDVSLPARPPS